MATLFEISDDMAALDELLNAEDLSDEAATALICQWAEENMQNLEAKADGYCALIRTMEARAKARKEEADRLSALRKRDENNSKRMKDRLKIVFDARQMKKLETQRFCLSIQKNGGVQALEVDPFAVDALPDDCKKIVVEPINERIRERIAAGEELSGCKLLPRGESLRIR
jgi:mannitol-specific phosphotransferase system IIBC component